MMAILDTFKKKKSSAKKAVVSKSAPAVAGVSRSSAKEHVLVRPHITEKASALSERGVFVFEVSPRAGKHDIMMAIQTTYGVIPVKVNIVRLPAKAVFAKGKSGMKSGYKKAMVYLKKGDTIEII